MGKQIFYFKTSESIKIVKSIKYSIMNSGLYIESPKLCIESSALPEGVYETQNTISGMNDLFTEFDKIIDLFANHPGCIIDYIVLSEAKNNIDILILHPLKTANGYKVVFTEEWNPSYVIANFVASFGSYFGLISEENAKTDTFELKIENDDSRSSAQILRDTFERELELSKKEYEKAKKQFELERIDLVKDFSRREHERTASLDKIKAALEKDYAYREKESLYKFDMMKKNLEEDYANREKKHASRLEELKRNLEEEFNRREKERASRLEELKRNLEEEFNRREKERSEIFELTRKNLEAEFKDEKARHEKERDAFIAMKQDFERERDEFNKAKAIGRQEYQKEIAQKIKERRRGFSVLTYLFMACIIIIAYLLLFFTYHAFNNYFLTITDEMVWNINKWVILTRAFGSALAFLVSIVFLIKCHSFLLKMHIDSEQSDILLENDMLRAGWIIETMVELKTIKDFAIPNNMLEGLTKHLFEPASKCHDKVEHPFETILRMFKRKKITISTDSQGVKTNLDDDKN